MASRESALAAVAAPGLLVPLAIAGGLIASLAALLIVLNTEKHREREAARLEAVADLRAGQVEAWLRERIGQAAFAGKSPLGEIYWRLATRPQERDQALMQRRLESLREASGAHTVLITGGSGPEFAEPASGEPASQLLQAAVRSALQRNEPTFTPVHEAAGQQPLLRLDVAAALTATGDPPVAAVVLRFDAGEFLLPLLRQWPLPTRTGTALLVRRDGDVLVGVHGRTRLPADTRGLLAAEVMGGRAQASRAIDAVDFRGNPVLGVVRPVSGTPWHLVAKIDRDEVYAGARRDAWAVVAAALLAFAATAAVAHWLRARQALRLAHAQHELQEDRLRALHLVESIAQNSTDAIFAKDREGRYLLCNGPAAVALGRPVDELVGRADEEILPAAQLATVKSSDAEVMATGCTVSYQVELPGPRGTATYLTTKGALRDGEGRVVGVFGISRDISELQRYREQLEQLVADRTRELAARNGELQRTVGDLEAFSYSLSHDLRQPLRTIAGFGAVLQRTEGPALSEEGRRRLSRMVDGAQRMDRMIDDILRCSRAERMPLRLEEVDLSQVAREVLTDLEPEFPRSAVTLGALPVLRADRGATQQVLANLIGNALKFSGQGRTPRVEVGQAPGGTLYVRDNGIGFDPTLATQLFKPFHRLHADDGVYPGTGVGLSIVKRLLERHGGEIRAESQPGAGTTFHFHFGSTRAD